MSALGTKEEQESYLLNKASLLSDKLYKLAKIIIANKDQDVFELIDDEIYLIQTELEKISCSEKLADILDFTYRFKKYKSEFLDIS